MSHSQFVSDCRVLAVQVMPENRRNILVDLLTVYANAGKTIVFTQTKREADEVAAGIAGVIPSEVTSRLPFVVNIFYCLVSICYCLLNTFHCLLNICYSLLSTSCCLLNTFLLPSYLLLHT